MSIDTLSVREASLQHDVAFVSSIRTYGNLGPFRPRDKSEFKGVRLFDMLLRPTQVVCGSTVQRGDSGTKLYGNWGVIIGEGEVLQAFAYDATSYVEKGQVQSQYAWRNEGIDVATQLSRAIEFRHGYNEIDIALGAHSIAGIFLGDQSMHADGIDLPSNSVLEMIHPLGLPVYHLVDGSFFEIKEDVVSSRPTATAELLTHHAVVDESTASYMKDALAQRLVLPPRNAVSAGIQAGNIYRRYPSVEQEHGLVDLLHSSAIDKQTFASMAIFAAELTHLYAQATLDYEAYTELAARLEPDGLLHATTSDIEYYLRTGTAPDYLGKI